MALTELVFFFHKKTTKLVFLWPITGQKNIKVLIITRYLQGWSRKSLNEVLLEQGLGAAAPYEFNEIPEDKFNNKLLIKLMRAQDRATNKGLGIWQKKQAKASIFSWFLKKVRRNKKK